MAFTNRFEQTSLWQKTLGKQLEPDLYEKERDLLRVQFENFREKAKLLAGEIQSILPEFTVHDITHLDALWDTAELVTKDSFELTPAEAFVLGGTFLIHDLGMGLASFPNGLGELNDTPIWKDTVFSLLKSRLNRPVKESDTANLDPNIEKQATETVLRLLHAKHAEKLALVSWNNNKNETIFLIENTELREAYGATIGLIAHSHWWSVDELEPKLPKVLGAPGIFPHHWTIDPVKLACILRVADAIQIDDRRAPSFLRTIRKPLGYSDTHWNFQQKLYQPRPERNRLVFTSKSAFPINEVDSWWVCHDTLQMIDNELKEVDSLLTDTNRTRLNVIGVASIEDPKRLSRLIAVEGWQPIDTKIKVTNVARLVGSLGGEQLYGRNLKAPLRELIQNASDAIRARRLLESSTSSFGDITVKFGKDTHGQYIEVEDNGVGMSQKVLTGPFLDFGQSFWGTSLMHEELPGLESKGFSSTGMYGIGFFSVFMWGQKISVASKRFEDARSSTLVLEFDKGATSRPLLRRASAEEVIKDGGTRIKVWLSNSEILDTLLESRTNNKITTTELLEKLCPAIDCNILLEDKGKITSVIKANDWITIAPTALLKRVIGKNAYKKLSKDKQDIASLITNNMSLIVDKNNNIIGRASLYKNEKYNLDYDLRGIVTIGGFKATGLSGIIGILIGKSHRASRDIGVPLVPTDILADWATQQAKKIAKFNVSEPIQMSCASIARRCGGNTHNLKIAHYMNSAVTYSEIVKIIKQTDLREYIYVADVFGSSYERENHCKIIYKDNVFMSESGSPAVLQTRTADLSIDWPNVDTEGRDWFHAQTLEGLITEAFLEVWKCKMSDLTKSSSISSDSKSFKAIVGQVGEDLIELEHVDVIRKPEVRRRKP